MRAQCHLLMLAGAGLLLSGCAGAYTTASPDRHTQVAVRIAPWLIGRQGAGRIVVIFTQHPAHVLHFAPGAGEAIYAEDVANARAGRTFTMENAAYGFPARRLDDLRPGTYYVMGLLDWNGTYAYSGLSGGMYVSTVSRVRITRGTRLNLELSRPAFGPRYAYGDLIRSISVSSPELSAFWHSPVALHGVVVLPPGYENDTTAYPVVYVIHAFHATGESSAFDSSAAADAGSRKDRNFTARAVLAQMRADTLPKMIFVFPDAHWRLGHTEFADSANNGPWGTAFVRDLVPYVRNTYRVRPNVQFLTGHSSGAWAALWLQINHPRLFAGAWAVSPDPVDFRSFLGTDIYAHVANLYEKHGREKTYSRLGQAPVLSVRDAALIESAEGRFGGQLASFEAVFSPRGRNGSPEQLFDRRTGRIDERVALAWRKYDISNFAATHEFQLRGELHGKLHIIVGAQDNYFLEEPIALLAARLPVNAGDSITIVPRRNHFDIYVGGLAGDIVHQMDDVADNYTEVARFATHR